MLYDVVGGEAHCLAGAEVAGFDAAVSVDFQDLEAVAVAHVIGGAQAQPAGIAAGANKVAGRGGKPIRKGDFVAAPCCRVSRGEAIESGSGVEGIDDGVGGC